LGIAPVHGMYEHALNDQEVVSSGKQRGNPLIALFAKVVSVQ